MSFIPLHNPPIVTEAKRHDAGGKKAAAVTAAMRRLASKGRDNGSAAASAGKTAAVAVDGDRSSQHALKWAADHVLSRAQSFFLIHVRRKSGSPLSAGSTLPRFPPHRSLTKASIRRLE